MRQKRYLIGVDPDLRRSGYAIWDKEKRELVEYGSLSFKELLNRIEAYRNETKVIIEGGWLNKKTNWHAEDLGSRSEKIAYRVGQNHAVGIILESYCKESGIECEVIRPKTKKVKFSDFRIITGINAKLNQDTIDAIMLVYGL